MPPPSQQQIESLQRAARNAQDDGRAHYFLAVALMQAERFSEAADAFLESSKRAPNDPAIVGNYGIALAKAGRSAEALNVLLDIAQRAPTVPEMHFNVGNAYRDLARPAEGAPAYARAIALRPQYPDAHWNRATALLLSGQWDEGWREFEWRFALPGRKPLPFPGTLWSGNLDALRGKTILLAGEQGYGDVIQFVRYVPIIADAGARVIVAAQTDLKSLLYTVRGVTEAIAPGDIVPRYDLVAPLMSLGRIMRTTPETIPSSIPYISAEPRARENWRARLAPYSTTKKVGVVWAGRPTHTNDRNRSMRIFDFAPLASIEGVSLFSLQKGPASDALRTPPGGLKLIDWTSELNDFADTAALVSELDLIIAVDTAVAHRAGALGKPIWTLLPFAPDWRWMLTHRDSSPWYPTMRLFRQPARGEWTPVIEEVASALRALAAT
jgi:hypothetical protein